MRRNNNNNNNNMPNEMESDEQMARRLAREDEDYHSFQDNSNPLPPSYFNHNLPPDNSLPTYCQDTPLPPSADVKYSLAPSTWIPVYSVNGLSTVLVAHHQLPPRTTRAYAQAGYPGANTIGITNPPDSSVIYQYENVPLEEAIVAHAYDGGVLHREPYNTNGFLYRPRTSILYVEDKRKRQKAKWRWW